MNMLELQTAIYARLDSSAQLKKAVTGIYDYVPEETSFPYVVIGEVVSEPWNTKTTDGEAVTISLDIWSDQRGKKETFSIMKLIEQALKDPIEPTGVFVIDERITRRAAREEPNALFHGELDYTFKIDMEE